MKDRKKDIRRDSHVSRLRMGTMLVFMLLVVHSTNVVGQVAYPSVVQDAMGLVMAFINNPSREMLGELQAEIEDVEDVLSRDVGFSSYQQWSLHYVLAYLHYCLGLANVQGQNATAAFSQSADVFQQVVDGYETDFGQEPKKVFAQYMVAWCRLRSYLSGGSVDNLSRAVNILQGITAPDLRSHVYFLRGLCNICKASRDYQELSINESTIGVVRSAIDDFEAIIEDNTFRASATFFSAIAKYLNARFYSLYYLRIREDGLDIETPLHNVEGIDVRTVLDDVGEHARASYNTYQTIPKAQLASAFIHDLSLLQLASYDLLEWIRKQEERYRCTSMDQRNQTSQYINQLITPPLDQGEMGSLIQASAGFIGNDLNRLQPNLSGESKFWADIARLFSYVRYGPGRFFDGTYLRMLPNDLFQTDIDEDNRTGSIIKEGRYLRTLANILRNSTADMSGEEVLNRHKLHAQSLRLIIQFLGPARNATNNGSDMPINFANKIPSGVQATVNELIEAGKLALTLAGTGNHIEMAESRVLYATAHMLFLRAGQNVTDATLRAKIALYNALTLFLAAPDGLETVALQKIWTDILPQNIITTWPANLKNEAHYYRARIRREVEIDSEVEDEYELIDEVDPRAAFAIGYDLRPGNPDRVILGRAGCLASREDWRCFECFRQFLDSLGVAPSSNCGNIQIGPSDVRHFMLRPETNECNIVRKFIHDELDLTFNFWQAFSSPSYKVYPWTIETGQKDAIKGPMEFGFLQEVIDVGVVVLPSGLPWEVVVLANETTIVYQGEAADTESLQLSSGQRYMIIFWAPGYWPTLIDTMFAGPGSALQVELKQKHTQFLAARASKETAGNLLCWAGDAKLVAGIGGYSFGLDGKKALVQQSSDQTWNSVSKVVECGGNLYGIRSLDESIVELDAGSGSARGSIDKTILRIQKPIDIASAGGLLFIADGEGKKVVAYDPSTNSVMANTSLTFIPSMITAIGRKGYSRVAILDQEEPAMYVLKGDLSGITKVMGFKKAQGDGLLYPYRIFPLPELGYFGISDFASRRVYLFLPNGEKVCSIAIPDNISFPYHWIDYVPGTGASDIRIGTSRGMEILQYGPQDSEQCEFELLPGDYHIPTEREVVETGGWLSDWRF